MRLQISSGLLPVLTLALLSVGLSRCLAQQDSSASTSKPAATSASSDTGSADQSVGCKLDPYAGTTLISDLPNYFAGAEDLRGGMTCTFRINSGLPPFVFHFDGHPDNSLGNIEIREGAGSEIVQTIDNSTDPGAIFPRPAKDVLIAVDADFDGYKDLQLLSNCGGTGNCSYDFYLYDPKAHQFVHNEFLSSLTTPAFDRGNKQVFAISNSSAADWEKETYQYKDGDYTLIHREESIWDRDKKVVTVNSYDLRNGQMELVNSTTNPE